MGCKLQLPRSQAWKGTAGSNKPKKGKRARASLGLANLGEEGGRDSSQVSLCSDLLPVLPAANAAQYRVHAAGESQDPASLMDQPR